MPEVVELDEPDCDRLEGATADPQDEAAKQAAYRIACA